MIAATPHPVEGRKAGSRSDLRKSQENLLDKQHAFQHFFRVDPPHRLERGRGFATSGCGSLASREIGLSAGTVSCRVPRGRLDGGMNGCFGWHFDKHCSGSCVFFLEPYLFTLTPVWRLIGTAGIFLFSAGLAIYLQRSSAGKTKVPAALLSDNEVKKSMTATIDGLEVTPGAAEKVLSGNKVGGDAIFDIKNSRI